MESPTTLLIISGLSSTLLNPTNAITPKKAPNIKPPIFINTSTPIKVEITRYTTTPIIFFTGYLIY